MRHGLPDDLRRLAADPRLREHSSMLASLADSLQVGDEELDRWVYADLSLIQAVSTPALAREGSRRRRYLHALPAILVFVPILITWLGLSVASRAFNSDPADTNAPSGSFLEQWQAAFGGRIPSWLAFDRIATYTVVAILVLVVVSFWSNVDRRRQEEIAADEDDQFAGKLAAALLEASQELSLRRIESPTRFEGELTRSAQQLTDLHSDARKAVAAAKRATDASTNAATKLQDAVVGVDASVVSLDQRIQAIEASVRGVASETHSLTSAVAALQSSAGSIQTAVVLSTQKNAELVEQERIRWASDVLDTRDAFRNDVMALVSELAVSVTSLSESMQGGASSFEVAVDVAGRVTSSARELGDVNRKMAQLLEESSRWLHSALQQIPDARELQTASSSMRALGTRLDSVVSAVDSLVVQLRSAAPRNDAGAQA